MPNIKKPRGTADILPEERRVWQYAEERIRRQCARYGFEETVVPTFESTELFARGVGDTTDIVQKEMYTFTDKDGRSMTLRPEGTASVARSVLENGLLAGVLPLKLSYITNCFRYEKPQAGRSREFYQFGAELYGADGYAADATVVLLADSVLRELNLKNYKLHLNSIGCPDCRPAYRKALVAYFTARKEELCPTCQARLESNPLRILDCKDPSCKAICADAPRTVDYLCDSCRTNLDGLMRTLDTAGVAYELDCKIVRGLDYYTGNVFEFIHGGLGAQSTVGAGGRYNGLIAELGGQPTPGVGFAMGMSRLMLAMQSEGVQPVLAAPADLYVAPMGAENADFAFSLTEQLRANGICVETDLCGRSLKAQMKFADKKGFDYVVVVGGDEIASGNCELKNMKTGEKTALPLTAEALSAAILEK